MTPEQTLAEEQERTDRIIKEEQRITKSRKAKELDARDLT